MPTDYLMQVTVNKVTHHYIVRPGAIKKDHKQKVGDHELCWVEVSTGTIMSPNHDWVISIAELEERVNE